MGAPPNFSAMFSKVDIFCDFPFAYLEDESLPKTGPNCSLYVMIPVYMGGNNENDRVASPESETHSPKENLLSSEVIAVRILKNFRILTAITSELRRFSDTNAEYSSFLSRYFFLSLMK